MNRKENEPPNHKHLLGNTIGYQERCQSPESDTVSIFSYKEIKSSESSPISSPVKSERSWDGEREPIITAAKTKINSIVESSPRKSIQIRHLVNPESSCSTSATNPRRTKPSSQSSVVCQTLNRGPPQLIRQCDRTQNFVENLVDTSSQMIEVIWPLSASHCDKDYLGGKNLIGLRTFIQEVLKRSKTSYYTLQVALYYLILIKPYIPKVDFTRHSEITHSQRAMQCGRRMFLAALILASKYLQDRNYSARAWSKISGLKISEINSNEMTFVIAVNWKLHIPEAQFQRWANIVFKYSTSQTLPVPFFDGNYYPAGLTWKQIIPILTPDLDEIDIERFSRLSLKNLPFCDRFGCLDGPGSLMEGDATLKLTPIRPKSFNSPPFQPRIPTLPTPAMTPNIEGFCPPAARAWSTGQAMKEFVQQHQCEALKAASCEKWPGENIVLLGKPFAKVISGGSIISSPESMVSDVSTISSSSSSSSRTSRSSSVCSVTYTVGAYSGSNCTNLAVNHRSTLANLNGSNYVPACIGRYEPYVVPSENFYPNDAEMDATLALMHLARTDKWNHKKSNRHKRTRPLSVADNTISEEVKSLLSHQYNLNDCVISDSRKSNPSVLSRPDLVKNLYKPSTGSQAGSRKKPKSLGRDASWIRKSPLVCCVPSVGF